MSVRVNEARQHHLAATIDLDNVLAIFLNPRIEEHILGPADRNNLSAQAQDSAIFNEAELAKLRPSLGTGFAGRRAQREELVNV
jgi:hypothetical protein